MKRIITLLLNLVIFKFCFAQSQWSTSYNSNSNSGRIDDVNFVDEQTGFFGLNYFSNDLYKTVDGGNNWVKKISIPNYIRSIKFGSKSFGLCGLIRNTNSNIILLKTLDGGETWQNIPDSISYLDTAKKGICGISIPDSNSCFLVGAWMSPAYFLKSLDQANTWQYFDMSAYAKSLVDVFFINKNEGFAVGSCINTDEGGIILHTTNGGTTWQIVHKTMVSLDRVWKIQKIDAQNWVASIEGNLPDYAETRILKSTDGGLTWNKIIISNNYFNIQMVGFLNTQKGWAGGRDYLFETNDGGLTWNNNNTFGNNFNRFLKVNNNLAYLTGSSLYKYASIPQNIIESKIRDSDKHIKISPNPASQSVTFEFENLFPTNADLKLIDVNGKVISEIFNSKIETGNHKFFYDVSNLSKGIYFVILQTNEGFEYEKLIKH